MNKEFIPYEQALALKELGFNEHCFKIWLDWKGSYIQSKMLKGDPGLVFPYELIEPFKYTSMLANCSLRNEEGNSRYNFDAITAPLYQQAFRWFREKYKLHSTITSISQESWQWHITRPGESLGKLYNEDFYTFEEAELECLIELIEIVKNKN
jgi:hypothetical protein